jgi:cell division septal protein FtsQ
VAARRKTSARAAVLPARRGVPEIGRLAPSGRSILVGVALLLVAALAYAGARETSVFAVRTVEVRGGTPALRAQVRQALRVELGASLLRVSSDGIDEALAALPGVRSFTYDRAFPHMLRVVVRPEQPVLVLRRVPGTEAYLVSATGRVIRPLAHPRLSSLPRLWVTKDVHVTVGAKLSPVTAAAAQTLSALRGAPLPGGVHVVQVGASELTLVLASGFEVRLGDDGDLRLKLAVAQRILRATGAATGPAGYLDVSVPVRPVLAAASQVAG